MDDFPELLRRLRFDLTTFANRLDALLQSQSSVVRPVTVVLPAGETSATAEHGLGRAHRGAVIVGMTPPTPGVWPAIPDGSPLTTTTFTVAASSAPGADVTILLWVF